MNEHEQKTEFSQLYDFRERLAQASPDKTEKVQRALDRIIGVPAPVPYRERPSHRPDEVKIFMLRQRELANLLPHGGCALES